MIAEEKEQMFDDWIADHRTFIWAEIKSDLSDALTERQLRYLINKRSYSGYITKTADEYTVVGKIEQLKREMEMEEKENPVIVTTTEPKPEPVKEVPVVEEKEKPKEVPKQKEPDIIKEKVKAIEKIQTQKRINLLKAPKVVIKPAASRNPEKSLITKYWYLIAIPIVGLVALLVYKLFGKTDPVETPATTPAAKTELEGLGFVDASTYFQAK